MDFFAFIDQCGPLTSKLVVVTSLFDKIVRMQIWALVALPAIASAWVSPTPTSLRSRTLLRMSSDEFTVAVLGDLHMDPRKMEDYEIGRDQVKPILAEAENAAVVSLGDLGESKSVRPKETSELFAGTTECHELAAKFLSSFGVPYEVIGGNHDLEGLDEFATDQEVRFYHAYCQDTVVHVKD